MNEIRIPKIRKGMRPEAYDVVLPHEQYITKPIFKLPFLWKHAYLAYYYPHNKQDSIITEKCKSFIPIQTEKDFAYVAIYESNITISFQGTGSQATSWASNFNAFPYQKPVNDPIQFKIGPWGIGTIHDGFYSSWLKLKPFIRNILKKYNIEKYDILITGHSRGGSIAECCARDIAKNLNKPCTCYTFGAPGTGNVIFQNQFRLLPINGIRVINGWDIVSFVAPHILEHGCAKKIWFRKHKIFRLMPVQRIKDHFQEKYDEKIMKKYEPKID